MSRTVLIVDDNRAERAALAEFLRTDYAILEADSGDEAIRLLHKRFKCISAIVLDVAMPGMDGFDTLKKIKSNACWLQIPVIITTSLDDEESRERAIAFGADNFVTKPYNRALLLHIVGNAVKLRETAAIANALWRDSLTGLLNHESFFAEAERMLRRHGAGYYALSCFDVENFKVINDQYGSDVGDEVLRHIAGCLSGFAAGVNGLACRYMADKFAILYPADLKNFENIKEIHRKIMSPACIKQTLRIRIGRYLANDLSLSVSAMYDRAAIAEGTVKGRFDTFLAEYTEDMRDHLLREQQIVNSMEGALAEGEFEPWFQPQYNHATGAVIGSEALVRWRRDGLIIPPDAFVPVFERNGFIYEVDQSIWRQVCGHLRRWLDEGKSPLPVSVNISRYDLFQKDFLGVLTGLVREYGLPVELLRLEITESAFAESTKTIIHTVNELIRLGFTVEIDDFGSGYSSLNTLKDVPASILKLDMRFFEATENSQRGGNIIESVVRMAKWLGMSVIAEGVEDKGQADYLKSIGCYYIQGYYYARPMPADAYEALFSGGGKEPKLSGLETLETLDTNEFWNPKSMETLIFNSYVGGACIFEYAGGRSELLRVNEQYTRELGSLIDGDVELKDSSMVRFLDEAGRETLSAAIHAAIEQRKEAACEVRLSDGAHAEYVRITLRQIARAAESRLFYAVIVNMTEQREAERKQVESARQLEIIMNNINGGVSAIQIDDDGASRFVFTNDRYYELYGYTRAQAEALRLDVMKTILPEDFTALMAKVKKLKADRVSTIIDYRCIKRDGRLAYLRANASMMYMEGYGDVIAAVVTDITEIRELEDQLRAVVDNINGGVTATVIRDGVPAFIVVNDRFFQIHGYAGREAFEKEGAGKYTGIHPEDRDRVKKQFESSDGGKKQYTMEYRIIRKNDGAVRYIRNNISVIRLFGVDEPVQLSVANDVTEMLLAQQKERETADKLSAVLNHAGNGITAIALGGETPELLFANDMYFEIVGYTREEYHRATRTDLFAPAHPEDREALRELVTAFNKTMGSVTASYRVIRPDGKTVWIQAVITITRLAGVEGPVQIGMFSDVTAEREAGEQLRFLNDSAHDILAQPDSGQAIRDTLERLTAYFAADRGYVVELDHVKRLTCNTYEVCAPGVRSERDNLQATPFTVSDSWYATLAKDRYFIIDDVDALGEGESALRSMLLTQEIHAVALAPLWRDGVLIGFAGLDNPKRATDRIQRLTALADYIAMLLTRRDLDRKIERDKAAMESLPRELLDHLPCGAALYEYDGRNLSVIHINKSYWELVERAPVDYSEASVFGVIHPDDRAAVYQEMEAALQQKRNIRVSIRILCGKGGYKPFHIDAKIALEENGKCLFYTTYTPISEQSMSMQEMLPIALSTMMSASEELSYVKDRDLRYICCSDSVAQLLGLGSAGDIVGKTDYELFERKLAEQFACSDERIVEKGESLVNHTERVPEQGGAMRLVSTSKYPIMDPAGNVIGLYGVSRDITAQREKESQLELLAGSIPGGIAAYAIDEGGVRVLYFNDGYFAFSGYSREEFGKIVTVDPLALVFEEDKPIILGMIKGFAAHKTDGHVNSCIYRCHTKGGGYRWMSMRTVLSKLGEDQYIVNVVRLDITEQQEEKERLRVSEELNRLAIEQSGNIITRFDVQNRTLTLPDAFNPIFVLPHVLNNMPEEQIALGRVSPDTADAYRTLFEDIIRGKAAGMTTYKQNSSKGWRWLEAQYTTVFSSTGKPMSAVISFADITEKLEKEVVYNKWQQSLNERPEDSYALFRCNLSKGTAFDSWEGKLLSIDFSEAENTFDGRTAAYVEQCVYEADQKSYLSFVNANTMLAEYYRGHRSDVLEYRERGKGGTVRWLRLTIDLVEYPSSKDVEAYLMYEDIDGQKKADLLTLERSERDPLTGILNRAAFIDKMERVLADAGPGEKHALLMLDVDNFKRINDTMGHGAGDQVLRDLTGQIGAILRHDDLMGRLGGDEFFVFLRNIPGREAAAAKARRICEMRIAAENTQTAITVSVGIAMIPKDGKDFDELYKKADAALYRKKERGKAGYLFVTD